MSTAARRTPSATSSSPPRWPSARGAGGGPPWAIAVVAALLGATAVADATGLLASGEPIETLLPRNERAWAERYQAPHGTRVVVTAPDADYRFGWGVGIYTTAKGEDCAIAGQVLGGALGRERDGRFHRYGPRVIGSCGNLDRLPMMSDSLRITGPHPRTLFFGRVGKGGRQPVFSYRGERITPRVGPGGAFLMVFDGVLAPSAIKLLP